MFSLETSAVEVWLKCVNLIPLNNQFTSINVWITIPRIITTFSFL